MEIDLMTVLAWILFGGLAGLVASFITGMDDQTGCVLNIVFGVIGAVVGGFVFRFFGGVGFTGFNLYSFLVSVIGAVIVLGIIKIIRK